MRTGIFNNQFCVFQEDGKPAMLLQTAEDLEILLETEEDTDESLMEMMRRLR
jgi:hypothetical protein